MIKSTFLELQFGYRQIVYFYSIASRIPPCLGLASGSLASWRMVGLVGQAGLVCMAGLVCIVGLVCMAVLVYMVV